LLRPDAVDASHVSSLYQKAAVSRLTVVDISGQQADGADTEVVGIPRKIVGRCRESYLGPVPGNFTLFPADCAN
jgi:hypothetical protein